MLKKLINSISSPWLMAVCLVLLSLTLAIATFFESRFGTPMARTYFYNAKWFEVLFLTGSINLITSIFIRKLYTPEKFSILLFHLAFVVIILGAGITRYISYEGIMQIREGENSNTITLSDNTRRTLPFSLHLTKFIVDYYPGSQNPSGFESHIILIDQERHIKEEKRIFMNNILRHHGYRFYQSSFHSDLKGTILSVSKDGLGTSVTYAGYLLMALGMMWSLLNKNSRFRTLISKKQLTVGILLVASFGSTYSQMGDSLKIIPREQAEKFGTILVRDYQGRTKPMITLASDVFRKITRETSFKKQEPLQVLLGMLVFPEKWQDVKIVYTGTQVSEILGLEGKTASLLECYTGQGRFLSTESAYIAAQKTPSERTKAENALIRFDERINITYHWFMGNMLDIFPNTADSVGKWYNPISIQGKVLTADSAFVYYAIPEYLAAVKNSLETNDWSEPDKLIEKIKQYQQENDSNIPDNKKVKLEIWYYYTNIFKHISLLYLICGLFLLILRFIYVFSGKNMLGVVQLVLAGIISGIFLLHTAGMAVRWYISDHAPWSNAYESMLLFSWAAVCAGLLFIKKNSLILAIATVLASMFLLVANMSWMDPQITNLVPVLKSIWLKLHVLVIMFGYVFMGIGALMALINLIIMAFRTKSNCLKLTQPIDDLIRYEEITLTVGLYLLTIGTFLGAVWANVAWGRYWGWDPKETWALITVIIYAFVLHMRLVPGLKSSLLFNIMALLAFGSVLMTYFGVNFYLTGMHSYAQGEAVSLPAAFYIICGVIACIIVIASVKNKKINKYKKINNLDGVI